MLLYFDTGTNNVAQELTTEPNSTGITIKRGVNVPLEIFQRKKQATLRWPDDYYVKFVLKSKGKYEQDPPLASAQTNVRPADDASPYLLALNADTAKIRTEMRVDGDDSNDPDFIECMGFVLYSPDGTDNSWVEANTIPVLLDNRGSQDDDAPPAAAIATRILWLPQITDYIGGASNQLDSVPTVSIGVPQAAEITVAGIRIPYDLVAGTDAESSPAIIRPDDYDAGTNAKVWKSTNPIPGSGSITYPIAVANGGTGATDPAGARTNLGLGSVYQSLNANLTAIAAVSFTSADRFIYTTGGGSAAVAVVTAFARSILDDVADVNVRTTIGAQASSSDLTAIAALTSAADKLAYATGSHTWALTAFTSTGRDIVGGANAAAVRSTLGLVIGTNVQAHNAFLDGIAANTPGGPAVTISNVTLNLAAIGGNGSALTQLNASAITSGTVPAARGGAGTALGLLKADGAGNVTAAAPGVDYTAPGAGAGINGQGRNFTCPLITPTGSAVNYGEAARDAYAAAKLLSPNGSAISATNRSGVGFPPGRYHFGSVGLAVDGEHVDLFSLTGDPRDVILTSNVTATSSGTIVQTADDVHYRGLTIQNTAATISANDSTDASAYAPGTTRPNTIIEDCIFDDNSGTSWSMQIDIGYNGVYKGCSGGQLSFGGGGPDGRFDGTAIRCEGGVSSFGGSGGACSGYFEDCTGGDDSFAGTGAFGGVAVRSTGGTGSFGAGSGGTLTGKLYYCRLTAGSFRTVSGGGKTRYCIDGSDTANNQG